MQQSEYGQESIQHTHCWLNIHPKGRRKLLVQFFGILILSAIGVLVARINMLHNYRLFIESRYKQEFSLIEREMLTGKNFDMTFSSWDAHDEVLNKIRNALSARVFFHACWSSDGHHGIEQLKTMPEGLCYNDLFFVSRDRSKSHSLYFGESDGGTRLLVYVGRVQSQWKRQYEVVFDLSEIQAEMKKTTRPEPSEK
jgi:hypothetical protein